MPCGYLQLPEGYQLPPTGYLLPLQAFEAEIEQPLVLANGRPKGPKNFVPEQVDRVPAASHPLLQPGFLLCPPGTRSCVPASHTMAQPWTRSVGALAVTGF